VTVTDDSTPTTGSLADPLAELRRRPVNLHLLGGYGPLIVALLVAALMVALLPSVAGEKVVERPKGTEVVTEATIAR
jgi:hypothetical protein